MTTFNTYVDPILLDLPGNGVKMTGIEDGVMFDVDHSNLIELRQAFESARAGCFRLVFPATLASSRKKPPFLRVSSFAREGIVRGSTARLGQASSIAIHVDSQK